MRSILFILISIAAAGVQVSAQIGIGTTTPNSMLDVRGSMSTNFRTFTAGNILSTDNVAVFTGTANLTTVLPTAVGITGRAYWIKNAPTTSTTYVLTVNTTSSQTIDGVTSWVLDEPNEMVCFVSNGTNWFVLNQDVAVAKTSTTGSAWLQGGNRVTSTKSIGTISNFDLPFITNNTEKMRLTSAGFLGLGLVAPLGRFHLVTQGSETGNDYIFDDYGSGITQGIYLSKSRGTIGSPSDLGAGDQIGHLRFVPRFNGSLGTGPGSSMESFYRGNGTTDLSDLKFFTSNAERMKISETGNVAIGSSTTAFNATNPEKLLIDAGSTTSFNVLSGKGSINNYLQLNIQNRADSSSASSDIVATANNGNEIANFIDMGINSGSYSSTLLPILGGINTAYLYSTGRDFVLGNASSTYNMIFFTNGFANTDEKMRINSTGNVGIGAIPTTTEKLTVAGNVTASADNLYTLGKTGLRWTAVWSANGLIQTSDARLKTNIQPLNYGLREVMAMKPVRYNWLSSPDNGAKIGLIAQEVKQIVPEVVVGDESKENLGMNYSELIPVLINAIQEQEAQILAIQNNISDLKKYRAE